MGEAGVRGFAVVKPWLLWLSKGILAGVMLLTVFLGYGSIANRWYRVVTIDGNSMAPALFYGDAMIVTPPKPREQIAPGTILLMAVDNRMVTHRLMGWEGDRPITRGDANPTVDDFTGQQVRIMGMYWFHLPRLGYINLFFYRVMVMIEKQAAVYFPPRLFWSDGGQGDGCFTVFFLRGVGQTQAEHPCWG
jgi:signal peptidase I